MILWLWAVLWLSFGLFLFKILKKFSLTLQGWPELNVIRPSHNSSKAAQSVKTQIQILPNICCQILHFCMRYSNKTGFWQCVKVNWRTSNFLLWCDPPQSPLLGTKRTIFMVFGPHLSSGKSFRSHFFWLSPYIWSCQKKSFNFWMIFSTTWSLCNLLQLAIWCRPKSQLPLAPGLQT